MSRVVGYRFDGHIDVAACERVLTRAVRDGVVTQFDSNKSMEFGRDCVWFNGRPGAELRAVRRQIASLVIPAPLPHDRHGG